MGWETRPPNNNLNARWQVIRAIKGVPPEMYRAQGREWAQVSGRESGLPLEKGAPEWVARKAWASSKGRSVRQFGQIEEFHGAYEVCGWAGDVGGTDLGPARPSCGQRKCWNLGVGVAEET